MFVGSGAPKGKELDVPGRHDTDQIFIGIDWLESIHFGHVDSVGKRVLIIGVGNTAMDCCRSAKRLGATDVKVIARKTRKYFKASPWELEDAEEEGVEILENLQPVRFIIENGILTGMEFDRFKSIETASGLKQEVVGREILPCDSVVLAVGQDNAFPWIERNIGLEFGKWDMPVVDKTTFMSTRPGVFFGGDAAFGPANIIWAVEQGHQAAISIHNYCQGIPVTERPAQGMTLTSTKMGLHEWAYSNDYDPNQRQKMQHVDLPVRFASMTTEVEKGFTAEQTRVEVERCLNCDMETHFVDSLCIECDACVDICPGRLPDDHARRGGAGTAAEVPRAGAQHRTAGLHVRAAQADQPGHGEGRKRLPALRPVRRTMPDLRMGHAEVCAADSVRGSARGQYPVASSQFPGRRPAGWSKGVSGANSTLETGNWKLETGYWQLTASASASASNIHMDRVNNFAFKIATANGTGSASANGLIMQAIFRMGVPVTGKNVFPSNIQGLPTWYEIRVSRKGYTARTPNFDLMVAMNPATYQKDVTELRPRRLARRTTRPGRSTSGWFVRT